MSAARNRTDPETAAPSRTDYLPQRSFGGAVGGLLAAVIGAFLLQYGPGETLRNASYDFLFGSRYLLFGEDPARRVKDVVVVELTEQCFRNMETEPSSLNWTNHADLVRRLAAAHARAIVMDIAFIDPSRTNLFPVEPLAKALQQASNVVLTAGFEPRPPPGTVSPPIPILRQEARGWGVGVVHWDTDLTARRHHPGTEAWPSLAWKAAELLDAPATRVPSGSSDVRVRYEPRWLNYYADPPFERVPYSAVILADKMPADFTNKVVFVGAGSASGYSFDEKEEFRSPTTWASGNYICGVELHALTFSNLMRGDWLRRPAKLLELFFILVFGAGFGYAQVNLISFEIESGGPKAVSRLRRKLSEIPRPLLTLAVALGTAVAMWAVAVFVFLSSGVWFPWLIVVAVQIPIAFAWALTFKTIRAHLETQFLARSLAVYVSPGRVKQLMKEPHLLKPGGVKRQVSVLFSDIAGFSKHCELKRWEPDQILRQLNGYYESAIGCIYQTEGTVMDLVGDAIFALWNAPQDQIDHQARACRSAILLHKNLVSFDAKQDLPWRTRIGLHTGEVCIGNIGSQSRFDYTAVGETINLASRLEGLNKQLGTSILATGLMQQKFGAGFVSRRVGNFKFKGFNQIVEVHEVLDEGEQTDDMKVWLGTFEQGLRMFVRGKFSEASSVFKETIALRHEDGPSSFYLKIIERGFQPPEGWFGEIDLSEK